MEVGQNAPDTFPNMAKNHDPSPFQVQKSSRMKYDTQTKMIYITQDILDKTLI